MTYRFFIALLIACATTPLAAQEGGVFLVRKGNDTLAVEVMTRTAHTAEATLRYRTPVIRFTQRLQLAPDETVQRLRSTVGQSATGDSAVRSTELTFMGDSVHAHVEDGTTPDVAVAVPAGAIPFLNLSGLSLELILRRARAIGGDSVQVPLLVTGAAKQYVATVVRVKSDSASVTLAGVELRIRTDSVGRMLGAAVPAQNVVFERLPVGSPVATWTGVAAAPSYAAPAGGPYSATDVVIHAPAGDLAGTLTMPPHAAGRRVPAALLISGSGAQDRDEHTPVFPDWHPFREITDTLSRRGIAVLRLDDRGVGGSAAAVPQATLVNEADDVRAAVAWLRARPDIDPSRIALLGHSSGAAVAPMVASTDPRIAAVVLIAAPASTGRQISAYQIRSIFEHDASRPPAQRDSLLRVALTEADSAWQTPGWLHFFGDYDPLPVARRVKAPTLVLQGETDRQVPLADARRLAAAMKAAGNTKVTLRTFANMNHLMVDDPSGSVLNYGALTDLRVRQDLRGVLADWLARTLRQ